MYNEFESFELSPEYLGEFGHEYGYAREYEGEIMHQEGTFGEASQMELASELLAVTNEMELDRFLGKLFKKAVGGVGSFMKSGAGKALGGVLKTVAKTALPIAGGAIGTALLPGVGTALGSSLGGAAANMFELEFEGLSQEDREFETAKAFVRFAGNAARRAASAPPGEPAQETARRSTTNSAKKYATGMLRSKSSSSSSGSSSGSGRGFYILADRIRRLEDAIYNLSSQMGQGSNSSSSSGRTADSDPEFENW